MSNTEIKCPVCSGNKFILAEYYIAPGHGASYFTGIPLGMMSAVRTTRYVCKSCGYLMEFFSKEDVEKLEKKYGSV